MRLFRLQPSPRRRRLPTRTCLRLEELEARLVPYTVTGNSWPNPSLITLSFIPDGTVLGSNGSSYITSNLFATLNSRYATATWQAQFLKAAQTWAQQANINFALVGDDGTESGWGLYQQGDPAIGDIRIGGYDFGGDESTLAVANLPPPINNSSLAGDVTFNTGTVWRVGGVGGYDIYTVALHEIGHALGLGESTDSLSAMYAQYAGKILGLGADDVSGIQAIYGPRPGDTPNNSFAAAADLTGLLDPVTLTAQVTNQNLAAGSSADYFSFTTPALTNGTITVQAQSTGLSLLAPVLTVYAANQHTVVGSASGANRYGATLTVTLNNVLPNQTYYVKVNGTGAPANDGVYALTLNLGFGPPPDATPPNTQLPDGVPFSIGGGLPESVNEASEHGGADPVGAARPATVSATAAPSLAAALAPAPTLTAAGAPAAVQGFSARVLSVAASLGSPVGARTDASPVTRLSGVGVGRTNPGDAFFAPPTLVYGDADGREFTEPLSALPDPPRSCDRLFADWSETSPLRAADDATVVSRPAELDPPGVAVAGRETVSHAAAFALAVGFLSVTSTRASSRRRRPVRL